MQYIVFSSQMDRLIITQTGADRGFADIHIVLSIQKPRHVAKNKSKLTKPQVWDMQYVGGLDVII